MVLLMREQGRPVPLQIWERAWNRPLSSFLPLYLLVFCILFAEWDIYPLRFYWLVKFPTAVFKPKSVSEWQYLCKTAEGRFYALRLFFASSAYAAGCAEAE